jgi:hypothetical protein
VFREQFKDVVGDFAEVNGGSNKADEEVSSESNV